MDCNDEAMGSIIVVWYLVVTLWGYGLWAIAFSLTYSDVHCGTLWPKLWPGNIGGKYRTRDNAPTKISLDAHKTHENDKSGAHIAPKTP